MKDDTFLILATVNFTLAFVSAADGRSLWTFVHLAVGAICYVSWNRSGEQA